MGYCLRRYAEATRVALHKFLEVRGTLDEANQVASLSHRFNGRGSVAASEDAKDCRAIESCCHRPPSDARGLYFEILVAFQ